MPDSALVAAPTSRLRVAVGAAVVLALVGLGAAVLAGLLAPSGTLVPVDSVESAEPEPAAILVDVLGEVAQPGLYELPEGARVVDAVAAAGGFTAGADRGAVNLARPLVDAEQLVVPALGAEGQSAPGDEGLINLNTADETQLETLPRIGPALAQRIVQWRESNGGFRSVEDLLAVTGIGAKTLNGLSALVTV